MSGAWVRGRPSPRRAPGRAVLFGVLVGLAAFGCDEETVPPVELPADAEPPSDAAADQSPDSAPAARVWFVEHGAAGGDGSRSAPFADPDAAYAVARSGDLVILLPGEHPTPTLPPDGVELTGSGSMVTTVAGPLVVDRPVILGAMTIAGGVPPLRITAAGRATIDELRVQVDSGPAVTVEGTLEGRDLSAAGDPALLVQAGGAVDVAGGALDGPVGPAVVVHGRLRLDTVGLSSVAEGLRLEAGEAVLETAVVDGVTVGVRVLGGQAAVRGGLIRRARAPQGIGAAIRVMGGSALVEDLTIEDCDRGLRVDPQGTLEVRGAAIRDSATDGLSVQGGSATASGLVVLDPGNVGVAVLDRGRVELSDTTIDGARRAGVLADGATVVSRGLVVQDAAVRGITLNRAIADLQQTTVVEAGDVGLQITDPVERVAVREAHFERCGTSGIAVFGDGGEVLLDDIVVRDTRPGEAGLSDGIHLFRTRAELSAVTSVGNGGAGVFFEQSAGRLDGGSLLGNTDPGLVVLEPPTPIEASALTLDENGGAGALVIAGELRLVDSLVARTSAAFDIGPGHGAWATAGGRLSIQGGQALQNSGSGVAFDPATTGQVGDVDLDGNQGYGLLVSCGAMVEEPAPSRYSGNGLGERSVCDR